MLILCNAVIHGLAEAPAEVTAGKERLAKDIEKLEELIAQIDCDIEFDTNAFRTTKRLGAKKDDTPRPLLVQFKEVKDCELMLSNAKKLNDKAPEWKKVSVVRDLTKMQREEEIRMRAEVVNQNAGLSEDDAKNWVYKMVGKRGERKVVKMKVRTPTVAAAAKAEEPEEDTDSEEGGAAAAPRLNQ